MNQTDCDEPMLYRVVVDAEERYSLWLEYQAIPIGWRDAGKTGSQSECLDYINTVWTDMRPLSLRHRMEEHDPQSPQPST
jgi:MbtH protein